jgi:enoyl-CoA hydratase/carnithine racemase
MTDNIVSIEHRGDIAIVRFDRHARANALSFAIMDRLTEAALGFETDARVAAVVLTGAPAIFSAGMDLADPAFDRLPAMDLADRRMLAEHGPRLARAWASIEAPTVAAIEGPCLAGGLALAAMLDFRVAARNARFAAPEIQVAHNMGWHSVPRLVALVGAQATRRLLIAGDDWSADMAHRLGFVDRVVAPGEALTAAMALAERLAGYPRTAARMIKRQIIAAAHGNEFAVSALDKDQQLVAWMSEDFAAARARFKRGK